MDIAVKTKQEKARAFYHKKGDPLEIPVAQKFATKFNENLFLSFKSTNCKFRVSLH